MPTSFRWVGRTLIFLAKYLGSSRSHHVTRGILTIYFVRNLYIMQGGTHSSGLSGYVKIYPYNPLYNEKKKKKIIVRTE